MDTLALLRAASTATLTSVLREHGLRNTFMHGVAPLRPDCRVAGPAFTLRYIPDVAAAAAEQEHLEEYLLRRVQDGAA